ncbi:MAG: NUDIX domain-containing protein [Alphaproteobacteria bacterium]|nr:NUDIX domain-containing protein [Alphaproteobacteria bacterium]
MSTIPPFPWTILRSQEEFDNRWLRLTTHDVLNVAGNPHLYSTIHIKRAATGVVAIDAAGRVALVGQHRFPLRIYSWEVPEGGAEPGEAPLEAIQRELKEEAGLTARHWQQILTLHLSNMLTDEVAYGFLAHGLTEGEAEPEESEVLALDRVPFQRALAMVDAGTITDAISVALLLRVDRMARTGDLPADLARAILAD